MELDFTVVSPHRRLLSHLQAELICFCISFPEIFRRLVPLAPEHNLRLVLINRRDYPGSSPYTEADLEKIAGNDSEMKDEFVRARALEFATFIKTFVEKEIIPKVSSDWKRGGITLMAWSSGNAYTLPLLSYADAIPEATRQFLEPYLRSLIVLGELRWRKNQSQAFTNSFGEDAPRWVVGAPQAQDALRDLSLSEEERV